jgi:hypothetical protein
LDFHKELYKLSNEINGLHFMLIELEGLPEYNLDELKELNSVKYEKEFFYNKKLENLLKIIQDLNRNIWLPLDSYNDIHFIQKFFVLIGFSKFAYNYDVNIVGSYESILEESKKQVNEHNSTDFAKDIDLEAFKNLIVPLVDKDDNLFSPEFVHNLYTGWARSRVENPISKKKKGLYLINFNMLYNKTTGESAPSSLVYSYYNYNTMFTVPLIRYIEGITKLNVKSLGINNSIFVVDKLLEKHTQWDSQSNQEFLRNNTSLILPRYKHFVNVLEYIKLLSMEGPLYTNMEDMSHLLQHFYFSNLEGVVKYYNHMLDLKETEQTVTIRNFIKDKTLRLHLAPHYNRNIIFHFYFLVTDLDSLLYKLKTLHVSGGPQSNRAKISLTDANLTQMDFAFRKSMALEMAKKYSLNWRAFSFKNIHMNCGNIYY